MWQRLHDCGKQLTIHSKLRENADNSYKLYKITEVEFDQYHLELLGDNDKSAEAISQVLNCTQLTGYGFEVKVE